MPAESREPPSVQNDVLERLGHATPRSRHDSFLDFTIPNSSCPVCGAAAFFVRPQNGGSVWFDALGPPWPRHSCMDVPAETWGELSISRVQEAEEQGSRDAEWMADGWSPLLIREVGLGDRLLDGRGAGWQRLTAEDLRSGETLGLLLESEVLVTPGDLAHWFGFDPDHTTRVSFLNPGDFSDPAFEFVAWDRRRYRYATPRVVRAASAAERPDRLRVALEAAMVERGASAKTGRHLASSILAALAPCPVDWRDSPEGKRTVLASARDAIPKASRADFLAPVAGVLLAFF